MKNHLIILLFIASAQVFAVDYHQLANPEQQKAYETIISELRCLVCQNQTIADSNAELAADLRRQVYEMLQQGKSKDDVLQFMTQRYGDFVLYNPPFKTKTGLLWLGPLLFLITGLAMIIWIIRRKKQAPVTAIDKDKQEKIRRLLDSKNEGQS
jgi:cytochrome c-type biogenesis protein CcmH